MAEEVRDAQSHVDVILPTYRGRPWVDEAIQSVVDQTHESWSLFVVDDSSDDGTFAHVCARWSDDPRITALALESSQRAAAARMQAIDAGDGRWLAFIDQDDRWHPDKLARQLARAEARRGADAVHTDCVHIADDGGALPGAAQRENAARARVPWDTLRGDDLARVCFHANRIRLASRW